MRNATKCNVYEAMWFNVYVGGNHWIGKEKGFSSLEAQNQNDLYIEILSLYIQFWAPSYYMTLKNRRAAVCVID